MPSKVRDLDFSTAGGAETIEVLVEPSTTTLEDKVPARWPAFQKRVAAQGAQGPRADPEE